mmetsp:Transcript_122261/g.346623  ORF Transcript_122261/g.346623 Transcript_122261/m.346623 type:complete len:233 (+) Transcript_122261:556-1254(+)
MSWSSSQRHSMRMGTASTVPTRSIMCSFDRTMICRTFSCNFQGYPSCKVPCPFLMPQPHTPNASQPKYHVSLVACSVRSMELPLGCSHFWPELEWLISVGCPRFTEAEVVGMSSISDGGASLLFALSCRASSCLGSIVSRRCSARQPRRSFFSSSCLELMKRTSVILSFSMILWATSPMVLQPSSSSSLMTMFGLLIGSIEHSWNTMSHRFVKRLNCISMSFDCASSQTMFL